MSRVVLVLTIVFALLVPLQLALPGSTFVALVPGVVAVQHAVALGLLWSGRQQASAWLVASGAIGVMAVILYPLGGLGGTPVMFVGLAALLSVTWLDPKPAAVAVGAFLAILVGVWWLGPTPDTILPFDRGAELRRAQTICAILATTLVFGLVDATNRALHATSEVACHRAEEAARAATQATRASEAKARFLGTMSHELRTPLNAILGYAGLLRDEAGADADDLERIEAAGRQLLGLVDDLLELVRAEQAPRPNRPEPVDLRALVDAATSRRLAIAVSGPDRLIVETDAGHVRRIVELLLDNAMRQGLEGRIAVALSGDADGVRLAIRDDGEDTGRAMLPLLLEPFVQPNPAGTERNEIGIALAQRLAAHIGARIVLTPVDGRSATTSLYLPARVP